MDSLPKDRPKIYGHVYVAVKVKRPGGNFISIRGIFFVDFLRDGICFFFQTRRRNGTTLLCEARRSMRN